MADERASLILRIATDPVVRLWGGVRSHQLPADDPLDPSGIYGPLAGPGRPQIGALPVMQQLVGGTAQALDFTFTGVDAISKDWVDSGSALGAVLNLGLIIQDREWQQDGPTWWMWKGVIATASASGGVDTSIVTLNVESAPSYRARAGLKMFTPQSHRIEHPTDDFLNRVPLNARLRTLVWK